MKKTGGLWIVLIALSVFAVLPQPVDGGETGYTAPKDLQQALAVIVKGSKGSARIRSLCRTPGDRDLPLLEIGENDTTRPAILVVANMEGNCPMASEAALRLGALLTSRWTDERDRYRWYIIPVGNPDGYARFFARPVSASFVNEKPVNDDNDDATDEDGPEDLNGDGFITMMRQPYPGGEWMAVDGNPVLLKKADKGKGEKGTWRLFTEGIDNDGDGKINEDGPGGVNPGHNFPHNFKHYVPANGPWAASETESRAILRFAFDHPEIAMVITLGRSNSLKNVPENSRKAQSGGGKYKVPDRWAKRFGLNPDKEYPIGELLDLARDFTGYKELTEDQLLQWLGVGAAVNPSAKDLSYWKEISKRYNDFIKDAGLDAERLDPPGFADGCVEEWAYYQYGVPSFSMDFWTLPKKKKEKKDESDALTPEKVEGMSNEDFIALGEEKIGDLLKASGAPPQFTAEMVVNGLKAGRMTTKRIAKFLRKSKEKEEAGGADETEEALYEFDSTAFVPWTPFDHPTLGRVEIGGRIAGRDLAPPAAQADSLVEKQLPFLQQLVALLPKITIADVKVENRSPGVWKVEAWITNEGFLPYPTHQGERCQRPTPAVVTITGNATTLLEGRKRKVLGLLGGSGGTEKVSWLVQADAGKQVTIEARTRSAGGARRTVTLRGGNGQ